MGNTETLGKSWYIFIDLQNWNWGWSKLFPVVLERGMWPHKRGGSCGRGWAAAALRTTTPTIPSARQQQQLGCCDIAGSQRFLWLQRLGCWVETSALCLGRCQIPWFCSHSCSRRRLQFPTDSALVCVEERLHRANALAHEKSQFYCKREQLNSKTGSYVATNGGFTWMRMERFFRATLLHKLHVGYIALGDIIFRG